MDARPSCLSEVEVSEDESDSSPDELDEDERIESHLRSLPSLKRSELQRDRVTKVNKAPEKRRRHERKRGENNPKNVSTFDRISKFPGEFFESRSGRLYCGACSEFLSMNLTTLKTHIRTRKHEGGKARRKQGKLKEAAITEALRTDSQKHKVGNMLPEEERVYRVKVVDSFLRAGIPLSKVNELRELLEAGGHRLTRSSGLSELIPAVHAMARKDLRADLGLDEPGVASVASRFYSVIFDGSTRQGEAIAIIIRYVNEKWDIVQRLARIDIVARAVTANQLSQVLMESLYTDLQLRGQQVLAMMRDGASVNGAAIRNLQAFMPKMMDITCFAHTLDNVGSHFNTPFLDDFAQAWVRLFSSSWTARLRWKERTGQSMKTVSNTRWWSWWELLHQLLLSFGDVEPFLDDNEDVAPKTMDRLRVMLADENTKRRLKLELAAVVDVGKHFVTATYDLEGDSGLALSCYQRMQAVCNACQVNIAQMHFANLHAVALEVSAQTPDVTAAWAENYGRQSVRDAVHWFLEKFNVQFYTTMRAFKAARMMCPATVHSLGVTPAAVQQLRAFPFLDDDEIVSNLADELPLYLATADGTSFVEDDLRKLSDLKVKWWRDHAGALPHWSQAVKKVLLVQPSSAAAERVFSVLNSTFGDQQEHALRDYLECAVMLQYNNRQMK